LSSVLYCIVLCWTVRFTVPSHITVHYITSHILVDGFILNNIPVFLSSPILLLPLFLLNHLFCPPPPSPSPPPPPDPTARLVFLWHCQLPYQTRDYSYKPSICISPVILVQHVITVLYCSTYYCTVLYNTLPNRTILYYAVPYCLVQCYNMQFCTA